ncbi:MAG: hypothetical protein WAN48_12015 [Actinomycetes bacterium]
MDIAVEIGRKKVFAWAVDWPGWCRSARDQDGAVQALDMYWERYAAAVALGGITVPTLRTVRITETLPGTATTDFGAPDAVTEHDQAPLGGAALKRQLACLSAAWASLDQTVSEAPPSLRKGPRGGGRDRDAVLDHVLEAERAYARKVGVTAKAGDPVDARRDALLAGLALAARPTSAPTAWPVRYALRRITWHVLDHVWEIEDRTD